LHIRTAVKLYVKNQNAPKLFSAGGGFAPDPLGKLVGDGLLPLLKNPTPAPPFCFQLALPPNVNPLTPTVAIRVLFDIRAL